MSVLNVKNKRPFIIGLTGGIATGKSSVISRLKQANISVVDSDEIVAQLWRTDRDLNNSVSIEFKIPFPIDKKKLGKLVFNDPNRLKRLNEIIHPKVFKVIDEYVSKNMHLDIIVIDMPLLFEVNYQKIDLSVLVYATQNQQLERLMARDKLSKVEAKRRIELQMPINQKLFRADYVIYNNDTLDKLAEETKIFIEKLGV